MKKWINSQIFKFLTTFQLLMVRLGVMMHNTEEDVFRADPSNLDSTGKMVKMQHTNPILRRMEQGQRDEQYVKHFYEILMKADHFIKNSTPDKIATTADKYGMNLGKKDRWGRRYDHFGFFDPKNKNYGKTLGQVMQQQIEERRTKEDDYEIIYVIDNKPIGDTLSTLDFVNKKGGEYVALNEVEKAKVKKFPIKIYRGDSSNVVNKIEQLTDYIHVKIISKLEKIVQLEFFIDKKFKLKDHLEDKVLINELCTFKTLTFTDDYGKKRYFTNDSGFYKYIDNNTKDVLVMQGKIMDYIEY